MRACRQHNHMFTKVVTPSVNAHSNISLKWMDFRSATSRRYIHTIWQRQCIKIKQPLHAACFSGKRAKQLFLIGPSIIFYSQSYHWFKHHVTSRDSSRVAERHNFFTSGSSHLGPKQTRPKPSRPKINSAQNSLGPGLRDISSLFSFLFLFLLLSFFSSSIVCIMYWELISLKEVSIQKNWKSGAL